MRQAVEIFDNYVESDTYKSPRNEQEYREIWSQIEKLMNRIKNKNLALDMEDAIIDALGWMERHGFINGMTYDGKYVRGNRT